jgi:hypothetical protein
MLSCMHRASDACKSYKLALLTAHQWFCFEERNNLDQQVTPTAYDEHQRGVACAAVILSDASTSKPVPDEIQDLSP